MGEWVEGESVRPRSLPWTVPLVGCLGALLVVAAPASRLAAYELPASLSDAAFWQMVTEFSEPGGSFPSNNFVSNETAFQTVVPRLKSTVANGGVYIGVGPDQNFTYISALRPRMAFIIDIRRQNLLHQLLFKALIELSPSRVEFLSRLFSRPRPPDIGDAVTAEALLDAYSRVSRTHELFDRTQRDIAEHLVQRRKFPLSEEDLTTIKFIHQAFFDGGGNLTYAGMGWQYPALGDLGVRVSNIGPYPTYQELMTATDGAGTNHSYLATDERYRVVRELELSNLIIPIVGDFGGPKAIRSVGTYIKQQRGTVTTFYTSNVEQYLFQNGGWQAFYDNVSTLPLNKTSTFIRSYFPNRSIQFTTTRPGEPRLSPLDGRLPTSTLLCSVEDLLSAFGKGTIGTYQDVIGMSK
jgi:hypothetical protein